MNVVLEGLWVICRVLYYVIEAIYHLIVPPRAKNIAGEVALVTGAGRGIGREIALTLAKRGAHVAVCDINETECAETARIINESGGKSQAYRCDVTSVAEVGKMAELLRRDLGDVDILVNNAGVASVKTILELSEAEIHRTMNVNAIAQFWTVREFLPSMITKRHGHVVVIASMSGVQAVAMLTDYSTSKFAAHGFAEALTKDLRYMKVDGIDVTTVYPLFVDTNMVFDVKNRAKGRFTTTYRFQSRNLTPIQVAEATVEGIVRRQRYVYIPSVLPAKVQVAVMDFLQAGFKELTDE